MPKEIWFRSNSNTHQFLSNFFPCKVVVGEIEGASVEHVYQALKCHVLEDRRQVLSASRPLEAMRLGRKLGTKFEDSQTVMKLIVHAKFVKNPSLMRQLLATGSAKLIEDNGGPWGGRNGGENWLGKILMELRDNLGEFKNGR